MKMIKEELVARGFVPGTAAYYSAKERIVVGDPEWERLTAEALARRDGLVMAVSASSDRDRSAP